MPPPPCCLDALPRPGPAAGPVRSPGGAEPPEAPRRLLTAVGVEPAAVPAAVSERESLWRSALAGRKVLYLDNAASNDQARARLPGEPSCTVLVSGRRRLCALPAAASVTLPPLDAEDSRRLLGALVGERRPTAVPGAVRSALRVCAGLPLAVTLSAAVLRQRTDLRLPAFAERLAGPLRALRIESDSLSGTLATALDGLPEPARRALRRLGGLPEARA